MINTIREYANEIFNKYNLARECSHDTRKSRIKIEVLRDVCIRWEIQDYHDVVSSRLNQIIEEANRILE